LPHGYFWKVTLFLARGIYPQQVGVFHQQKKKNSANKFTNPLEIFGVLGYIGMGPIPMTPIFTIAWGNEHPMIGLW